MSARQSGPFGGVARKWLALAERRVADIVELRDSGRWRHYYTWEGLLEALHEAMSARDAWATLTALEEREAAA
jgi:hypothetical protein